MLNFKKYIATVIFAVFVLTLTVAFFALPKASVSEKEKRKLKEFPAFTTDALFDGSYREDAEEYVNDHFPFRDFFVGLHSYAQLCMGQNGMSGIYSCDGGYLIPAPAYLDEQQTIKNLGFLRQLSEKTGLKSYLMVVPEPGYIMADKLPSPHRQYGDDVFFELVRENAGDIDLIDLRDEFLNADEDLYYRTDHHLNSAGTYLMYRTFCESVGITAKTFAPAETHDGFYGTGYSKSGLWFTEPDQLEIWLPEEQSKFSVTVTENVSIGSSGTSQTFDTLYFRQYLDDMDQYPVFLGGNHSVVNIKNENCKNGRNLLIIKDSYANCFSTFAAENFQQITIVDPRYYKGFITDLIAEHGCNEILYLYGAENLASSTDISVLALDQSVIK